MVSVVRLLNQSMYYCIVCITLTKAVLSLVSNSRHREGRDALLKFSFRLEKT